MKNEPYICKIYSRRRLDLFKKQSRNKNRSTFKIYFILCMLLIFILITYNSWSAINPIFQTLCEDTAKSIATKITNEESTKVMASHTYDELYEIEKDSAGKIQLISANIVEINEITSDIAINIQNALNNSEGSEVKLSIGAITGSKYFSGSGPKFKVKISSVGNVDTELKSEFIKQSINQTLHRVYLQIDCNVNVLTPFYTVKQKISNQVLLAENVIVGEVPETYYNLDGIEGSNAELEVIE